MKTISIATRSQHHGGGPDNSEVLRVVDYRGHALTGVILSPEYVWMFAGNIWRYMHECVVSYRVTCCASEINNTSDISVYVSVCMYVRTYVRTYVCTYVRMYVCIKYVYNTCTLHISNMNRRSAKRELKRRPEQGSLQPLLGGGGRPADVRQPVLQGSHNIMHHYHSSTYYYDCHEL